jgi:GT2 family glycosyltransferase
MNSYARLSVVIPTWQRRLSLARMFTALARQTLPCSQFEVVVVVDGSTDGTQEWIAQQRPPFPVRSAWQQNRGRAAACNHGVRLANAEIVVLLDDDMEPYPTCLAAHLRAHADRSHLGVVGGVPIPNHERASPTAAFVRAKFNRHLTRLAEPGHQFSLRDFYSGNFSIRRTLFLALGGFDEEFKIYGNEDLELSIRLLRAGVSLMYVPEACARQWYDKDFAALARDTLAKGQTAVLLARKHPDSRDQLKLGSDSVVPWRRRLLRGWLLRASRRWPRTPQVVVQTTRWLERVRAPGLTRWYDFSLDYFYWLGVGLTTGSTPEPMMQRRLVSSR